MALSPSPARSRPWPRRVLIALLLAPPLALALLVGERTLRDAGLLPEAPASHAEAEVELARGPDRLIVYAARNAEVEVLALDGVRIARLASHPPANARGLPLRDGDLVLYLGAMEAMLGRVPRQGEQLLRRYRLPDEVKLWPVAGGPLDELPLALRCGDEVLLGLERGWARLALGPGRRYRRGAAPPFAPRLEGGPPSACRPLRPVDPPQLLPVEHALHAEVWRGGRPFVLGAPRVPPPYLVLVGPDGRRARVLRPPAGMSVPGSALLAGPHIFFHGSACDLGELRLTYANLEDPDQRASRWSLVQPIRREGCRPGPLVAQLCEGGREPALRVEVEGRSLSFRLGDGARVPDPGGRCRPLAELRRDAADWEAARTLEVGRFRYRLAPGKGRALELHAEEAGRASFRVPLEAPAYLLGATDDALLLVSGDALVARERSNGARRTSRSLAQLKPDRRGERPRCRFIGAHGRRGYLLVQGEVASLLVFDGERVRVLR